MTGLLQDIINHLSVKSECTTVAEYGLTVTVNQAFRLSNRVFRQRNFFASFYLYEKFVASFQTTQTPSQKSKNEFSMSTPTKLFRVWYHFK